MRTQWKASHDWKFSTFVTAGAIPGYSATCHRCGLTRGGPLSVFRVQDCPGRVITTHEPDENEIVVKVS